MPRNQTGGGILDVTDVTRSPFARSDRRMIDKEFLT